MSQNNNNSSTSAFPWKEFFGFLGVVLAAYIGYLGFRSQAEIPIHATQTAEAKLTMAAQSPINIIPTGTPTNKHEPLVITETPLQSTQTPVMSAQWTEGEILLQDDFEDGNTDGWLKHGGNWKIIQDNSGNHVLEGQDIDFAKIEAGRLYWENYAFEVEVKVISKSKSPSGEIINLLFLESPNCDGYDLIIFNTWVNLLRHNSGGNCISTSLKGESINLPFNEWTTFRIEITNDIIRYLMDETEIFLIKDSQPISKGTISLAVQENGVVWFDNVQVIKLIQP